MSKKMTAAIVLFTVLAGWAMASPTAETPAAAGQSLDVEFLIWWAKKFSEDDALIKAVGDKFNANFKITTIPHNVYFDQINVKIAADDLPVLYKIQIPNTNGFRQLAELTEDGRLESLTALADRHGLKDFKAFLDRPELDHVRDAKGNVHISPIWNGPGSGGLYTRRDWMEKMGAKQPDTWAEMETLLKQFKQANPSLAAALGGGGALARIISAYTGGYVVPIVKVNGQWAHIAQMPRYKEAVTFVNRLYTQGLLHPTSLAGDAVGPTEFMRLMTDGNVAILDHVALGGHWKTLEDGLKKNFPDSKLGFITPTPKGPDGRFRATGPGYYGGNVINANKSPELQRRAVAILDYLFSAEGTELMFDGIEGVHYRMEGGKKVQIAETRNRDFVGSYSNLIDLVDRSIAWERESNTWLKKQYYDTLPVAVQPPVLGLATDEYAEAITNLDEVAGEYLNKFYTGELAINDANWSKYLAALKVAGLDQAITEVKAFMAR